MPPKRRLRNLNFGGEHAETDPLLGAAFYESTIYEAIESHADHHRFLIGRTGGGKSAILKHLEDVHAEHVIRIDPENLALNYILDLGVVRYVTSLGVRLDVFFNALWKHVFLVEVIRKRYKVDSEATKRQFLATIRDRIRRDAGKEQALKYLDDFGDRFWCETDQRVRDITDQLANRLKAAGAIGFSAVPPSFGIETERSHIVTDHTIEIERFQHIINETQAARLNKMITVLDEEILDSPQNFTYIVIDDLDRDWADEALTNDLIRCLFGAVLSLAKVRHLKVIVALRTNIFDHLNLGSRFGGQEEKYRDLAMFMRWTSPELIELLDERAAAIGNRMGISSLRSVSDVLPPKTSRRGDPAQYIFRRSLMRPRDAISFLNHALSLAAGKSRLSWADLYAAEPEYSRNRLLALRDEWSPTFPDIQQLFEVFRKAPPQLGHDEMAERLDEIALLLSSESFSGAAWLERLAEPIWDHVTPESSWGMKYRPLLQLLYDIGFIGLNSGSVTTAFGYEHPGLADSPTNLESAKSFSVHPAFHPALEIATPAVRGRIT